MDANEISIPNGMDYYAKQEFDRIKPLLAECGYLSIDQPALVAYLTHYANFTRARKELDKNGMVVITVNGSQQISPWHSILKQNAELMKKYINELGFSAASRKNMRLQIDSTAVDYDESLIGG